MSFLQVGTCWLCLTVSRCISLGRLRIQGYIEPEATDPFSFNYSSDAIALDWETIQSRAHFYSSSARSDRTIDIAVKYLNIKQA